jgi:hypothetical protein
MSLREAQAAEAQLGIAEDAYRDAANRVLKMARP